MYELLGIEGERVGERCALLAASTATSRGYRPGNWADLAEVRNCRRGSTRRGLASERKDRSDRAPSGPARLPHSSCFRSHISVRPVTCRASRRMSRLGVALGCHAANRSIEARLNL